MADTKDARRIPRFLFGYSSAAPQKPQLLSTIHALIMGGALPEHNQKRSYARKLSQQDLAAMSGLSRRETVTRRVSTFAALEEGWSDADRDRWSQRMKDVARKRGLQIHDRPRRKPKRGPELLQRSRGFAESNSYAFANLPRAICPRGCTEVASCTHCYKGCEDRNRCQHGAPALENFFPPTLKQLRHDPRLAAHWIEERDEKGNPRKLGGYKDVPLWVYDPKLPLTDTARLVFTYYIFCGLLDPISIPGSGGRTRLRARVTPRQPTVAEACGICVESVRNANAQLAAVGLIRVGHFKCVVRDGRMNRGPQIILYVPALTLTREEAIIETERLLARATHIRRESNAGWIEKASQLHAAELNARIGKECRLEAFWRSVRKIYADAGISQAITDALIPAPPN